MTDASSRQITLKLLKLKTCSHVFIATGCNFRESNVKGFSRAGVNPRGRKSDKKVRCDRLNPGSIQTIIKQCEQRAIALARRSNVEAA